MKLSKLEIAKRQLEAAAEIYVNGGDYLAVITLAGAAEEILGQLLRRTGGYAVMDSLIELDKELTGGRSFSVVNMEVNRARNALKHAHDSSEDIVVIEPGEATAMLTRALANYKALNGSLAATMQDAASKALKEVYADGC